MGYSEKKWMNTLCEIQNVHVIKDYAIFTGFSDERSITSRSSPHRHSSWLIRSWQVTQSQPPCIFYAWEWTLSRKIAITWISTIKSRTVGCSWNAAWSLTVGHPIGNVLDEYPCLTSQSVVYHKAWVTKDCVICHIALGTQQQLKWLTDCPHSNNRHWDAELLCCFMASCQLRRARWSFIWVLGMVRTPARPAWLCLQPLPVVCLTPICFSSAADPGSFLG